MKRLGIGLIVLSSLTACGEKEEEKSNSGTTITPGNGKLPLSELARPTGLADLTRADVISYMESSREDFLATEVEYPEDTETAEEEGEVDCFGDAFSSLEVVADGDKISVDINLDMTGCLKTVWAQESEGVSADISKAVMALYLEQTCVGADLSSYNGKKLEELDAPPECENNYIQTSMKSEMVGTMTANGQTVDINTTTFNSTATAANEPCLMTKSGDNYAEDGCVEIYKTVGAEGSEDNEFVKYTHKTLKWVDSTKNTWYASGSIDVELNAWTGSVTFSGASTNPAYTMNYGTETINGTLTVPSGLYFKNTFQRALMRNSPLMKTR